MIPIPAVSSLIPKLYTITKLRAPRRSRIGSGADCGAASRGATHERDDCGASDSTASWRGSDVYLVRPRAAMLYAAAQAPRRPAARASGTARQRCLQQRGGGSTSSTTCGREGEGGGGGRAWHPNLGLVALAGCWSPRPRRDVIRASLSRMLSQGPRDETRAGPRVPPHLRARPTARMQCCGPCPPQVTRRQKGGRTSDMANDRGHGVRAALVRCAWGSVLRRRGGSGQTAARRRFRRRLDIG